MPVYGIDASSAAKRERTGVEEYAYRMIQAMKTIPLRDGERVVLYSREPLRGALAELPAGWESRVLAWPLARGWMQGRMSLEMLVRAPDALFVPGQALPRALPKRVLTTVHDIGFARMPELYAPETLARLEEATARALSRADVLFSVSAFTKQELVEAYGTDPARVRVTPNAVPAQACADDRGPETAASAHPRIREPYFFFIGRLERKKNIPALLDAFEIYCRDGGEADLVLAGSPGFAYETDIAPRLRAMPCAERVHELGYVPRAEVSALLAGARALAFPSRYEGFGMPVLEALACGVPPIVSDIPAHHEVAGEAARYVPADDVQAWAQAMREPAALDPALARARVEAFSWKDSARTVLESMRRLCDM